jgi:phosphoribosylaminoimidazolecarboxamide formyltransferase/IMP cyclohydrolase
MEVKTRRAPTDEEWIALKFGWKISKHVKSNAIVYARAGQTISVGAGQMSRVDSVKVGAMKAVLSLAGLDRCVGRFFPVPRRRRGSGQARDYSGDPARGLGER